MAQPVMQMSFSAGEWAPALNARVDLAKYRSGAALLRNFFVDYRGGASTRPGTRYVLHAYKPLLNVRLIPFQASFTISYMMEFGDFYIRFFNNGAPVLEGVRAITSIGLIPGVVNVGIPSHGYQIGDWVYISGVGGTTQINNRYFKIGPTNFTPNFFDLYDLFGNPINSAGFGAYTGGGVAQRVYTLPSPYSAAQLDLLKYSQNVDFMVICHPDHQPHTLTFNSASNWTLTPITFGTTITAPTGVIVTPGAVGPVVYSYIITASDENGQESASSAVASGGYPGTAGQAFTMTISWAAVTGAISYNVYRAGWIGTAPAMPVGSAYGLIANVTGTSMIDNFVGVASSNPADYSLTPPILKNPFIGAGVASVTVTNPGVYTTSPNVIFSAPPSGGTATGAAQLGAQSVSPSGFQTGIWSIGENATDTVTGVNVVVATMAGPTVTSFQPLTFPGSRRGSVTGSAPAFIVLTSTSGDQVGANVTWGVTNVLLSQAGSGYLTPPTVTFSSGAAAATAVIGDIEGGYPTVSMFYQQRLVLAGPSDNPQRFNMSRPGSYYNYNESDPIQPDDAIEGFLSSGQLNYIKSMVVMSGGLITFSDKQAWLVKSPDDGGVTPINITAIGQAYNGASDLPPIVINYDVLYVQSKGSIVRDLTYNFYTNIYTGTDVTVVSSHLFYGHTIKSWAYAEEPYKVLWAVRDDGVLLSLTFLKEQELVGWAHSDTPGDFFRSVGTIVETVGSVVVDALYMVVERQGFRYIERMVERTFAGVNRAADAWCVDSGLRYEGPSASTFIGAEHLRGRLVTGLANGQVVPPFIMPANGTFTLPLGFSATKLTIGLGYSCDLQTLALDLGEPTVQGKRKRISGVTLRCQDTLGLYIGRNASTVVEMKDLKLNTLGSMTNQVVTDLMTGDARTNIDPLWDVPGQYFITQSQPFPATILGVIPEINVGDTPK